MIPAARALILHVQRAPLLQHQWVSDQSSSPLPRVLMLYMHGVALLQHQRADDLLGFTSKYW